MLRNKKSACGISNFECKKPAFRDFSFAFTSDPTNYNVKPELIEKRASITNFYNIPRSFQSVISYTQFISIPYPFNANQQTSVTCTQIQDPFSINTRYMYERVLQENAQYIKTWYAPGKQNPSAQDIFMDTYYENSNSVQQKPGILMPAATMAPFNAIGAIAIPTSALATTVMSGITSYRPTKSGCPAGFQVIAQTSRDKVHIAVKPGTVSVGQDAQKNDNTGKINNIQNVKLQKAFPDKIFIKSDASLVLDASEKKDFRCSIYAIAYIDQETNQNKVPGQMLTWKAYLFAVAVQGQSPNTDTSSQALIQELSTLPLPKYKLIANVIWNASSKTVDITSAQCSPVDLRDWVSQVGIAKSQNDDSSIMFFGMHSNSLVKKWFKVKDC